MSYRLMNFAALSLQCPVNIDMGWIYETVNCEYCCSVLYDLPYNSFHDGLMPTLRVVFFHVFISAYSEQSVNITSHYFMLKYRILFHDSEI